MAIYSHPNMWYFGFKNFILIERKFSILEYGLTFYLFETLKDPAFMISLKFFNWFSQLLASCTEPRQDYLNWYFLNKRLQQSIWFRSFWLVWNEKEGFSEWCSVSGTLGQSNNRVWDVNQSEAEAQSINLKTSIRFMLKWSMK